MAVRAFFCVIACLGLLCHAAAAETTAKETYAPDPGAGYPQILQSNDYPTIAFIEAWYKKLSAIAPARALQATASAELNQATLVIRSQTETKTAVALRMEGTARVLLGDRPFEDPAIATLCSTLLKIFADLEKSEKCRQVSFIQFGTRTYRRRTLIAFDFGPRVLQIDCASNGPKDDERLYILDLIDRKESYFWRSEN
jgi:hypothetical protein